MGEQANTMAPATCQAGWIRIIQDTTTSIACCINSLPGKPRNLLCESSASEFGFCLPNSLSNSPINLCCVIEPNDQSQRPPPETSGHLQQFRI